MEILKSVLYGIFVVTIVAYTIKHNKTNIKKINRGNREKQNTIK